MPRWDCDGSFNLDTGFEFDEVALGADVEIGPVQARKLQSGVGKSGKIDEDETEVDRER